MNNGTFAATTLGDAMSRQSSGSFAEKPGEAPAPLRDGILGALSDATGRDSEDTADSVLAAAAEAGQQEGEK